VNGAQLFPSPEAELPLYFPAGSGWSREVALEHANVVLLFGAPLADVENQIAEIRQASTARMPRVGLRINVFVRESEAEAWRAAEKCIARVHPDIRAHLVDLNGNSPHGRILQVGKSSRADLVIGPNLWGGLRLGRLGVTTAIVGTPSQVADRLLEYRHAGVDMFILSGFPKLAEVKRFGVMVMPRLTETADAVFGAQAG
jgi:alkanesulfonate monooxygenase